MDMNLLHDITFYVMYAAVAIAIFIAIERGLYFAYVRRQARALMEAWAVTCTASGICRKARPAATACP